MAIPAKKFDLNTYLGIEDAPEPPAPAGQSLYQYLGMDEPKNSASTPAPAPKPTGDLPGVALGAGLLNGVPIVGPALLSGAQKVAAGAESVISGTKYADELKRVQDRTAAAEKENSKLSTAGNISGAVGSYAIGGVPAAGAKILGMAGNMVPRMIMGGGSNALIGAADAKARGQDPIVGGVAGLVGGAGAPVAGAILGAGANALTNSVRGILPTGIKDVSRPAANLLIRNLEADDPAAVRAALAQAGEFGMLADAGPSMTGLTGSIALKPGDGKSIVENALIKRAEGAPARIGAQLDESLGPARDPQLSAREVEALRAKQDAIYGPIHELAGPIDASGAVTAIDKHLETATGAQKTALTNLRKELVVKPASVDPASGAAIPEQLTTNSKVLHNLRQDLDSVINYDAPGLGVPAGAVARAQGSLKSARGALDDVLKGQVPGMSEADAASALLANRQIAIERGYGKVLRADGPHPETFAADRAARAPGENIAENIGMRGRIDRMFGTGTQRDAVTLNKLLAGGEDGYSAANLKTAFGDEPVNKLINTLGRERTFANTTNEVVHNSATARRQAAGKMLDEASPGTANLNSASLTGVGLQAAKKWIADPLISMILRTSSEPMKVEMAKVLTMQGAGRDEIVNKLLALKAKQGSISTVGNAISQGTNTSGNLLIRGYSGTTRPNM